MATKAEVSITIGQTSAGDSVLVVAENLIFSTGVERGESIDPAQYVFKLRRKDASPALLLESLPSLFQGYFKGPSQGLPSLGGDLANQTFGMGVLYTQRHSKSIIALYTHL